MKSAYCFDQLEVTAVSAQRSLGHWATKESCHDLNLKHPLPQQQLTGQDLIRAVKLHMRKTFIIRAFVPREEHGQGMLRQRIEHMMLHNVQYKFCLPGE